MRFDLVARPVKLEQFNINKNTRKVISFFLMGLDYSADIEVFLPYTIAINFEDFIGNFHTSLGERVDYIINELHGIWHGYHSITVNGYLIHFELEEDAIMFKLRW